MTPLNVAIQELRLTLLASQAKADLVRHLVPPPDFNDLEDHRGEVLAELLDAIDRIEPNMGEAFLCAMYPFATREPGAEVAPQGSPA